MARPLQDDPVLPQWLYLHLVGIKVKNTFIYLFISLPLVLLLKRGMQTTLQSVSQHALSLFLFSVTLVLFNDG